MKQTVLEKKHPTTAKLFFTLRKELELTQAELAKNLGFQSKVFISKVESGIYLPSEKYIKYMVSKFPKKKTRIQNVFLKEKMKKYVE
ncbi:MAG: helix-turn-helix protein [bacterium ADurb.Bin212]|nr:MAG: helix-turn-helix protein [bacterium ADurb.Bin212]